MNEKMTKDEAMKRYNLIVKFAAVAAILLISYQIWSFFVSSRYQALCGASYWDLSSKQIDYCKDVKSELDQTN
ncbi:MAG: hypothetical protein N2444_01350 [Methylocystis sp.]|nr:hypothetical protein [Methylocystis sp.]